MNLVAAVLLLLTLVSTPALSQSATTAKSVREQFADINRKILAMAKDFPEDKYDFKLKPEMRTFGAVIVHIAGGNVYAAKAGKGEKATWDEIDPKDTRPKPRLSPSWKRSWPTPRPRSKACPTIPSPRPSSRGSA